MNIMVKWQYARIQLKGSTDNLTIVTTHHFGSNAPDSKTKVTSPKAFDSLIGKMGHRGWEIVSWSPTDCFFKKPLIGVVEGEEEGVAYGL